MEHKEVYDVTQEVPDESYTIPFGEANFTREGKDITFIGMGQTVGICNKVADKLKSEGKSAAVLDFETLLLLMKIQFWKLLKRREGCYS